MDKIWFFIVLVLGILIGTFAVDAGLLSTPTPDQLCNRHLEGDGWEVNLTQSTSLQNGTKLYCQRGNRTETITVAVDIQLREGG